MKTQKCKNFLNYIKYIENTESLGRNEEEKCMGCKEGLFREQSLPMMSCGIFIEHRYAGTTSPTDFQLVHYIIT